MLSKLESTLSGRLTAESSKNHADDDENELESSVDCPCKIAMLLVVAVDAED